MWTNHPNQRRRQESMRNECQHYNPNTQDEVFGWHISSATVGKELRRLAAQYEAGEREVPGE